MDGWIHGWMMDPRIMQTASPGLDEQLGTEFPNNPTGSCDLHRNPSPAPLDDTWTILNSHRTPWKSQSLPSSASSGHRDPNRDRAERGAPAAIPGAILGMPNPAAGSNRDKDTDKDRDMDEDKDKDTEKDKDTDMDKALWSCQPLPSPPSWIPLSSLVESS